MCGLVGAFGPSARNLASRIEAALEAIAHRGPDAQGYYLSEDGQCVLGHRRLSIVDLSTAGNQPVLKPGYAMVYNGEIYNHQRLRAQFFPTDYAFTSHSDTETLFQLLMTQPQAQLSQLAGMYATAFYQEADQQLLLFRDPLGIKPLYITTLPDSTVVFASEIKALLALLPDKNLKCDAEALKFYLIFENWPQGTALFQDIQLITPGALLRLSLDASGRVKTHQTQITMQEDALEATTSYEAWVAALTGRIRHTVKEHLLSDVPLGCYLSGGIDSSLVATLAAQEKADLMGFTGYFENVDLWYDERPLARTVANHAGIPLVEVPIRPEDFQSGFDALIYTLDEPRMGMGALSQSVVAREAAQHRKVILAGHGGDELFGGYPLFKAFWFLERFPHWQALPCLASMKPKEWPWLVDQAMQLIRQGNIRFAPILYPSAARLLQDNMKHLKPFVAQKSSQMLEQLNHYYRSTYLPGLLMVEDKISMAHSLETRVPLWSQDIYRMARQIPLEMKMPQGQLKGLLREVAKSILPTEILHAPKRGFPTPLRHWFRDGLSGDVHSRLLDSPSPIHDLVSKPDILKLLHQHAHQPLPFALDERRAHRIWILLCLESWFRQYKVSL